MFRPEHLKKLGMQNIIPIVTAVIAIVFIAVGLGRYGFWDPVTGPTPGFFPIIVASLMLVFSILTLLFSFRWEKPSWPVDSWYAVLGGASILGSTYLIGLIPSVFVYLLVWLKWFEKCTWKTTLITTAVTMGIVIGAFVVWLDVNFPKGVIYTTIISG